MTELPFQMSVNAIKPHQAKETLTCIKLLREVPNKRSVYQAIWKGQNVIAKIFRGFASGLRLKKEWNGLQQLLQKNLNTPHPCFYGTTADNREALVTKEITNALTAVEIYQNETAQTGRHNLLILVVRELAKLNDKGVLQKDIHLGNFLISGEQAFSLDAGQMTFYAKPLSRKKSLKQLAAILTFSSNKQESQNLYLEYAKIRNWDFNQYDETVLKKYVSKHLKTAIRKGLKKTIRTSKNYVKIRQNGFKGVFDRKFCEQFEPSKLFEQIDAFMDNGEILKNGNTCYVSRIKSANYDLAVKRYNYKGFLHSIRNTLKISRARHCWQCGHLLGMLAIATPKPLCFFIKYKGLFVRQSYIITQFTKGQKLNEILTQKNTGKENPHQIKDRIIKAIEKMHKNKITHGDLKHSNILINSSQVIFTDLDGMKRHWFKALYVRRSRKDMACLTSIS